MKKTTWNRIDWLVAKIKHKPPFKLLPAHINRYSVTQDETSRTKRESK